MTLKISILIITHILFNSFKNVNIYQNHVIMLNFKASNGNILQLRTLVANKLTNYGFSWLTVLLKHVNCTHLIVTHRRKYLDEQNIFWAHFLYSLFLVIEIAEKYEVGKNANRAHPKTVIFFKFRPWLNKFVFTLDINSIGDGERSGLFSELLCCG